MRRYNAANRRLTWLTRLPAMYVMGAEFAGLQCWNQGTPNSYVAIRFLFTDRCNGLLVQGAFDIGQFLPGDFAIPFVAIAQGDVSKTC